MARAADVLAEHNFTGEHLLKLARKIAADELRRRGGFLDEERMGDLVSFLALAACRAALRYDPTRPQRSYGRDGGDPFASYLGDIMARRVTDYYRSKAEGHGDRRYGNDGRVVLTGDDLSAERPDPEELLEREDFTAAERELAERFALSEQARAGLRLYRVKAETGVRLAGEGSNVARKQAQLELGGAAPYNVL